MDIKLDAKQIIEKEFGTSLRGYSKDEVDHFLDQIVKDYENFRLEIERLEKENMRLEKELKERSMKEVHTVPNSPKQPPVSSTNFDILKRLSNLERHVFGDKLNEDV